MFIISNELHDCPKLLVFYHFIKVLIIWYSDFSGRMRQNKSWKNRIPGLISFISGENASDADAFANRVLSGSSNIKRLEEIAASVYGHDFSLGGHNMSFIINIFPLILFIPPSLNFDTFKGEHSILNYRLLNFLLLLMLCSDRL